MRQFIFTILFIAFSTAGFAQIPDFFREYITLEIGDGSVDINGVYQIRNTSELMQNINLFYPFPIDSAYGAVSDVYAFETASDSTLNRLLKVGEKAAMVKLEIAGKSEKTLYIGYRQQLKANRAEYILTTTQKWNKPLESSQIELIVPKSLVVERISYQAIDTIVNAEKVHYFIHEINFMPEKNFIVHFSEMD